MASTAECKAMQGAIMLPAHLESYQYDASNDRARDESS